MKHEATSIGALLLLAVGGAVGCSAYSTYRTLKPGCDVEAAYDLQVVNSFETVGPGAFWMSADTAGASLVPTPPPASYVASAVEPISDGPHCGSTAALVIRSERNNDWGSLFGIDIAPLPRDASPYDGLSFWARASDNTTNAFTILLNDPNTALPAVAADAKCKDYGLDGGTGQTMTDGTGMVIMGSIADAPEPDQCGNPYSAIQVVTNHWRFYTIPFSAFQQVATPNRVPNVALTEVGPEPGTALLTNALVSLTFRMPKAATMELWIDNLTFYRAATGSSGGDAGVDAAQM